MKLQILYENAFTNLDYDSKSIQISHLQSKANALKKEAINIPTKISQQYDDFHVLMRTKYPQVIYQNISDQHLDMPECIRVKDKIQALRKRQATHNKMLTDIKHKLTVLKNPVEDTTVSPLFGIPNPLKLAMYKGGPANVSNPYHKHRFDARYAGVPSGALSYLTKNENKQYYILQDLLARQKLPNVTRAYVGNGDFIMVGNDGDVVWTISGKGQGRFNTLFINGIKYNASNIFAFKDKLPEMDTAFTIMNQKHI